MARARGYYLFFFSLYTASTLLLLLLQLLDVEKKRVVRRRIHNPILAVIRFSHHMPARVYRVYIDIYACRCIICSSSSPLSRYSPLPLIRYTHWCSHSVSEAEPSHLQSVPQRARVSTRVCIFSGEHATLVHTPTCESLEAWEFSPLSRRRSIFFPRLDSPFFFSSSFEVELAARSTMATILKGLGD